MKYEDKLIAAIIILTAAGYSIAGYEVGKLDPVNCPSEQQELSDIAPINYFSYGLEDWSFASINFDSGGIDFENLDYNNWEKTLCLDGYEFKGHKFVGGGEAVWCSAAAHK